MRIINVSRLACKRVLYNLKVLKLFFRAAIISPSILIRYVSSFCPTAKEACVYILASNSGSGKTPALDIAERMCVFIR